MSSDRVFNHVQYKYAHLSHNWIFCTKCVGMHHLNAFFFNNHSKGGNNIFPVENLCEIKTPDSLMLASVSHNCPSARCASIRNIISIDVSIMGEK